MNDPPNSFDALTGIGNRQAFQNVIDKVLKHTDIAPFSVLSIDVDNFRRFNLHYGFHVGDRLLVELARLMQETLGENGFLARTGGDRFGAVLPNSDFKTAFLIGDQLRRAVNELGGDGELPDQPVTISVGVATFNPNADDERQVLRDADEALYRAQAEGGDRVRL